MSKPHDRAASIATVCLAAAPVAALGLVCWTCWHVHSSREARFEPPRFIPQVRFVDADSLSHEATRLVNTHASATSRPTSNALSIGDELLTVVAIGPLVAPLCKVLCARVLEVHPGYVRVVVSGSAPWQGRGLAPGSTVDVPRSAVARVTPLFSRP